MGRRRAIVDGSNIAHEERTKAGKPRVGNIVTVCRELEERGFHPIVIVDAPLRHEVDDPDQLEALLEGRDFHDVPANTDADFFILGLAEREDAVVVSNDLFRDYLDDHPWIRERRVPVMIIRGEAHLYEPSLRTLQPD